MYLRARENVKRCAVIIKGFVEFDEENFFSRHAICQAVS